jgi:hypothetical protein
VLVCDLGLRYRYIRGDLDCDVYRFSQGNMFRSEGESTRSHLPLMIVLLVSVSTLPVRAIHIVSRLDGLQGGSPENLLIVEDNVLNLTGDCIAMSHIAYDV